MGSELVEEESGKLLWGLKPRMLARLWDGGGPLALLEVTPEEREGRARRVRASQLLSLPAWTPLLHGIEPYYDLVQMLRNTVARPDAVREFPYDWRLPVAYNGRILAEAAHRHLEWWTAQVASSPQLQRRVDRPPRLVFVAHSMGGLVTRAAMAHAPDLVGRTRTVVTLGTPFYGAVKAAVMLNGGRHHLLDKASRLVRDRLQKLTVTLPGVHDLLPVYRCVDNGLEVDRLTPHQVASLGGDAELAQASINFHTRLLTDASVPGLPEHRAVVGVAQPTLQSLRLDSGVIDPLDTAFLPDPYSGGIKRDAHGVPVRENRFGDGTVYRESAIGGMPKPHYFPAQHGALAKDSNALHYVRAVLTENDQVMGPAMGRGELGLALPEDGVLAGTPWMLTVTGRTSPVGVRCAITDIATGRTFARPRLSARDGALVASVALPSPGLYRIEAAGGGGSPVTQLLLAQTPE